MTEDRKSRSALILSAGYCLLSSEEWRAPGL